MKNRTTTGLVTVLLMTSILADAAILAYDGFDTASADPLNGIYAQDTGVDTAAPVGGSMVGFDALQPWSATSAYLRTHDNTLLCLVGYTTARTGSRQLAAGTMGGKTVACGRVDFNLDLPSAYDQGSAKIGFTTESAASAVGATIRVQWDAAGSEWDLEAVYNNGSPVAGNVVNGISLGTDYTVVWEMDEAADTLKVWVNPVSASVAPTAVFTDYRGSVSSIDDLYVQYIAFDDVDGAGTAARDGLRYDNATLADDMGDLFSPLLAYDGFATDTTADPSNGVYATGVDLGDAANKNVSGGTIVGFGGTDSWTSSAYYDAYAQKVRLVGRTYSSAAWADRGLDVSMAGRTEAYASLVLRVAGNAMSGGQVLAGFSDATLSSTKGAAVGYKWDGVNWDMVLRYSNAGGATVATIREDVAPDTYNTFYWSMNADTDTIRVWVNTNDYAVSADLTVDDWQGTVGDITHFSSYFYSTGAGKDAYLDTIQLGDTAEAIGMFASSTPGFLFVLSGRPDTDLYVAPTASGTGSGADPANAAAYTDAAFWGRVQGVLNSESVTVWFTDGAYASGDVEFENRGSAANRLYLKGTSPTGAILTASTVLKLRGSRNIEVSRLNFTGNCPGYAVLLQSAPGQGYNDCRDITIDSCTFSNMPDLFYGAISINGVNAYDITIENCTFDTMGFDQHAHSLYAAHNCHDILVQSNLFRDVSGHCLDFRNGVSNVVVSGNEFLFTDSSYGQEDANAIALPNWNPDADDREIYGNNYTICSNRFLFDADGDERCAVMFHFSGYSNLCGYTQIPTSNDVATLKTGSPKYKEEFLAGAGIDVPRFEIYGNTYNEHVFRRVEYSWNYYGNSSDTADIYNAFHRARFEDDFEYPDGNPVGWEISETPGYADVYTTDSNPAEGARSTRLVDVSGSHAARMDRGVGEAITRGYYRTWVRVNSHTSSVYPFYSINPGSPTIYWVYGYGNGTWRNNDETFSGSWTTGTWYCLELEFDFNKNKYTVWIDNSKVADGIAIPGEETALQGEIHITPATIAEQGDMQVDSVRLGRYEW